MNDERSSGRSRALINRFPREYLRAECQRCGVDYSDTGDGRPYCGVCRLQMPASADPVAMSALMEALAALYAVAESRSDDAAIGAIDAVSAWLMSSDIPCPDDLWRVIELAFSQTSGEDAANGSDENGNPFPDGFAVACCDLITRCLEVMP